jgi:outer membrane protein assembly factor BamD (BamD/ComL family)
MRLIELRRVWWCLALVLATACATTGNSYFDTPTAQIPQEDRMLFEKAVAHQKGGQLDKAIEIWRQYLDKYPKSYEAHNNLGMALYSKDQLAPAALAFEKAHELEPKNERIARNLADALKYQTTMYKDSHEYDKALSNLRRIIDLAPSEKEKMRIEIERMHDRIYEQHKSADTLESYKEYIETYPDSPNVADARKRIEQLSRSGMAGIGKFPESRVVGKGTLEEETLKEPQAPGLPAVPQLSLPGEKKEKAPGGMTSMREAKPAPAPDDSNHPAVVAPAQPKAPKAVSKKEAGTKSGAKIKIVTKGKPLTVRSGPGKQNKVVTHLKNGAEATRFEEKNGWVRIQYAKGKTGWIHKNFIKPLK